MKSRATYWIVATVFMACAIVTGYGGEIGMSVALVLVAAGVATDSRIAAHGAEVGLKSDIRVLREASGNGQTKWLRVLRLAFHSSGIFLIVSVFLLNITG